jgi:hypothetical protein
MGAASFLLVRFEFRILQNYVQMIITRPPGTRTIRQTVFLRKPFFNTRATLLRAPVHELSGRFADVFGLQEGSLAAEAEAAAGSMLVSRSSISSNTRAAAEVFKQFSGASPNEVSGYSVVGGCVSRPTQTASVERLIYLRRILLNSNLQQCCTTAWSPFAACLRPLSRRWCTSRKACKSRT